jgi:hypothetical protein
MEHQIYLCWLNCRRYMDLLCNLKTSRAVLARITLIQLAIIMTLMMDTSRRCLGGR